MFYGDPLWNEASASSTSYILKNQISHLRSFAPATDFVCNILLCGQKWFSKCDLEEVVVQLLRTSQKGILSRHAICVFADRPR